MSCESCPGLSQLTDFVVGELPENELDTIASHITECGECREALKSIDTNLEPLLSESEQSLETAENERENKQVLNAIFALCPDPEVASVDEEDLGSIRDYRLLEKIAQGGMGVVYKALHTHLHSVVALKVLPAERMADEKAVSRFRQEMMAVGKLDHPHIVRALDAGEHEGQHYLVMELVEGIDLAQLSRRKGALPISEACEIIRQAAVGLQYAHENELVHRDIKPSNLMLETGGTIKILDMGLALLNENDITGAELTTTGQIMGTVDYMAPEQAKNTHNVDIRTDIYSLGCTLYKLLSSKTPFPSEQYQSNFEKMVAHAQEEPMSLAELRDDLPKKLLIVLDRMMAKDFKNRFSHPAEVAENLAEFCGDHDLARLYNSNSADLSETTKSKSEQHQSLNFPIASDLRKTHSIETTESSKKPPLERALRRSIKFTKKSFVIFSAIIVLLMIGVTIVLTRPGYGDLVIEYDGNRDIQISVKLSNEREENYQVRKDKQNIFHILKGKFIIFVKGAEPDEFEITAAKFEIRRGDKTIVSIRQRESHTVSDLAFAQWIIDEELWFQSKRHAPHGGTSRSPRITAQYVVDGTSRQTILPKNQPFPKDMRIVNIQFDHPKPGYVVRLAGLKHIRELSIDRYTIDDWSKVPTEQLKILRHGGPSINSRSFLEFVSKTNLESLSIGNAGSGHVAPLATSSFLKLVDYCPNLKFLDLSQVPVQDGWMPSLAKLRKLRSLSLKGTAISDEGLKHIGKLPNLQGLSLTQTRVSDRGLSALSECGMLSSISLDRTLVSGRGLLHLKDLPALTLLLGGKNLGHDLPKRLQDLKNLVSLDIYDAAQFDDSNIDEFGKLNWLRTFKLRGCKMSSDGVQQLKRMLNAEPQKTAVDISILPQKK